jgi:ubiquinone/menaquinone biosynthesis C-methylase UbiE
VDRFEFFAKLPRGEPGDTTFTSSYLNQMPIRTGDRVLDLGSGGGTRAVWVARSRGCHIVAVDRDPRFLAVVRQRAEEGGAGGYVHCIAADYAALPFPDRAFRMIIAEGPARSLGLKQALTEWRRLLVPQGLIAVTYPGVINKSAPAEVREPLEKRMAEPLGTLKDYHATVRAAGFEIVHQVPLAPELWDTFYIDVERHAWALVSTGQVQEDDAVIREVLDEARWFRDLGRGRVFLQALVLRRVR